MIIGVVSSRFSLENIDPSPSKTVAIRHGSRPTSTRISGSRGSYPFRAMGCRPGPP